MYRRGLLAPQLELPPHHELEVTARLHWAQLVGRGHDVLRENSDPFDVALPFWGCGRRRGRGRREQCGVQMREGYE